MDIRVPYTGGEKMFNRCEDHMLMKKEPIEESLKLLCVQRTLAIT
jgi:hypothetical protein